jgi:hypothetical protein
VTTAWPSNMWTERSRRRGQAARSARAGAHSRDQQEDRSKATRLGKR